MASLINTKVKGTTIIEAIIAFVIVLTSFGICMTVYTNSLSSKNSSVAFRALTKVKEISAKTKSQKNYLDEQTVFENIKYEKKITAYPNSQNLYNLSIKASTENDIILVQAQEIITINK